MGDPYGLTADNLLQTLPDVFKQDAGMYALATAIAEVLADRPGEIDGLLMYSRLDQMPEPLLDIIAYDFKVDWWNTAYTVEEKRRTLRDSWHIHRTLGTKYAVVTAISAIYKNAVVQEWWEYGGVPYEFKLNVEIGDRQIDVEKHRQVLERIDYYKNLRSSLGAIVYVMDTIRLRNKNTAALGGVRLFGFFFNGTGQEVAVLDGRRGLDGQWRLRQGFWGAGLHRLKVGLAAVERNWISGTLTTDSMWRLDGGSPLDGGLKLNAAIQKEEI